LSRSSGPVSKAYSSGRGVLRNPWILAQAEDLAAGRAMRPVTMSQRGEFLLEYIELLRSERVWDRNPQSEIRNPQSSHDRLGD
jgi:tRNA-dihydrouridine synthase